MVTSGSNKLNSEVVEALHKQKKAKQKDTASAAQKKAAVSLAAMAKKRKVLLHRSASNVSNKSAPWAPGDVADP